MTARSRKRQGFLWVAGILAVALLAALGDAFLVEPTAYVADRVVVRSARLPDSWIGRKILLFSDTHLGFGMTAGDIQRFGDLLAAESPDLVLFLGDCVDVATPEDAAFLEAAGKAFGQVDAPLGKFACLGNHDNRLRKERGMFLTVMEAGGFEVLENRSVLLDGVRVGGLAEAYYGNPDPATTFSEVDADVFRILMAHQPRLGMSDDVLSTASPDLVFSGHTHGGQVTFFGLPLPVYRRILGPYISGVYEQGGTTVLVTRGVGTYALRARFFCRPEYVVVTLER